MAGFWKGLGKVLLRAAPIAASFIPGVGPIAGAALQAGLGAANAKASGGGWRDVLMGAGTGAAIEGGKGLAPSKSFMGTLGNIGKQTGKAILRNPGSILGGGEDQGESNLTRRGNLPDYVMNMQGSGVVADRPEGWQDLFSRNRPVQSRTAVPRGLGPQNLNFPNLAMSINQGRQLARRRTYGTGAVV